MIVNRKELLQILDVVKPGLSSRDIVEHLGDFIFTGENVVTYNDNLFISHPLETDGSFMVAATVFHSILSKISDKEVRIIVSKDKIKVKTQNDKVEILTSQDEDFMKLIGSWYVPESDKEFKEVPDDFLRGLRLCSFSASKDETEKYLKFIFVGGDKVVSSDDVRISIYKMEDEFKGFFLLHPSVAQELVTYKVEKYFIKEPWIYFLCENSVLFCSRIVLGDYPDVTSYFEFEGLEFEMPKDISECIEKTLVIIDERFEIDKEIDVSIKKDKLTCVGKGPLGVIKSSMKLDFEVEDLSFRVNPIFLLEAMQNKDMMFKISEDRQLILFQSDNFQHLMAL